MVDVEIIGWGAKTSETKIIRLFVTQIASLCNYWLLDLRSHIL